MLSYLGFGFRVQGVGLRVRNLSAWSDDGIKSHEAVAVSVWGLRGPKGDEIDSLWLRITLDLP